MPELRDINLNRLVVFAAVVEAGSLTGAAERLGLAKTMVSTHMQRLEEEVGTALIVRTTRQLSLTDAGRTLYEMSREFLRAAAESLAAVAGNTGPLRGSLRVAAPIDYGTLVVTPAIVALRREHPALEVELIFGDRYIDLVAERIDVAIRLGNLGDSSYRAVRLCEYVRWLVASPEFIDTWGMPGSPEALTSLPFVVLTTLPSSRTIALHRADGQRRRIRCDNVFSTNTAIACRAATLAGGGFGWLTEFSVCDDVAAGNLVRLLPEWQTEPAAIQAIFPSASHTSSKVAAVIGALRKQLTGVE